MTQKTKDALISVGIVVVAFCMMAALLFMTGCTTVTYTATNKDNVVEEYSMTTWFKSVEDLSVIRTPDLFALQIGSTNSDTDAITAVAKILDFYANPVN